jgi:hypothetical protein
VRREQAGDVLAQLLRPRRDAFPGDDERHDPLAEVVVRDADDGHLAHRRVLQQRRLDLAGPHLVAAGLDEVGGAPPHDAHLASGGERGDVPRVEEAVLVHRRPGGVGPVEVAGEDARPLHRDLAEDVRARRERLALIVHEPERHARQRRSNRAGGARPVVAGGTEDERLGEAVALDGALPEQPPEPLVVAHRQRGGAGDEEPRAPEPRRVGRGRLAVLGEPVVHRRHREEHRPARLHRGADAVRREAGEHLELGAHPQRAEHAQDEPVDVEERQGVDEDVSLRPSPRLRERVEVERGVPVGDHRPLGRACRPRRVEDEERVLRHGDAGRRRRGAVEHDLGYLRRPLPERRRVRGDDEPRGGVAEHMGELARADGGIERDRGRAEKGVAEHRRHRADVRRCPYGDAVAGPDSVRPQPGHVRPGGPLQVGVREEGAADAEGSPAAARGEIEERMHLEQLSGDWAPGGRGRQAGGPPWAVLSNGRATARRAR